MDLGNGKPCFVPLGSHANKQGQRAATNICGGNDRFPGVWGPVRLGLGFFYSISFFWSVLGLWRFRLFVGGWETD